MMAAVVAVLGRVAQRCRGTYEEEQMTAVRGEKARPKLWRFAASVGVGLVTSSPAAVDRRDAVHGRRRRRNRARTQRAATRPRQRRGREQTEQEKGSVLRPRGRRRAKI